MLDIKAIFLFCFEGFSAILSNSGLNDFLHESLCSLLIVSLSYIPGRRISRSKRMNIFKAFDSSCLVPNDPTDLHFNWE